MPLDLDAQSLSRRCQLLPVVESQAPWAIGVGPLDRFYLGAARRMNLVSGKERQEELRDRPATRIAVRPTKRRDRLQMRDFHVDLVSQCSPRGGFKAAV